MLAILLGVIGLLGLCAGACLLAVQRYEVEFPGPFGRSGLDASFVLAPGLPGLVLLALGVWGCGDPDVVGGLFVFSLLPLGILAATHLAIRARYRKARMLEEFSRELAEAEHRRRSDLTDQVPDASPSGIEEAAEALERRAAELRIDRILRNRALRKYALLALVIAIVPAAIVLWRWLTMA